jgi:hypothetical protein
MKLPTLLAALGALLVAVGLQWNIVVGVLLVWLGCDFLAIAVAHIGGYHGLHGKRSDGTLPWWSWMVFSPYYALNFLVWNVLRWRSSEAATQQINAELSVGRRLSGSEFIDSFANVIDLTAEFAEPANIRKHPGYQCLPILDAAAPSPDALHMPISGLRPGASWVHCAQGHGRTGLFALALLLKQGQVQSISEGLQMLRSVRPGIALNAKQLRCVADYLEQFVQKSIQC